jgi:hypothetical protein
MPMGACVRAESARRAKAKQETSGDCGVRQKANGMEDTGGRGGGVRGEVGR